MLGDYQDAIKCFEQAIALDPRNVSYRIYIAKQYMHKKDYKNAKRHLKAAKEHEPLNIQVYVAFVGLLKLMKQKEKIAPMLQRALRLRPGNPAIKRLAEENNIELK